MASDGYVDNKYFHLGLSLDFQIFEYPMMCNHLALVTNFPTNRMHTYSVIKDLMVI